MGLWGSEVRILSPRPIQFYIFTPTNVASFGFFVFEPVSVRFACHAAKRTFPLKQRERQAQNTCEFNFVDGRGTKVSCMLLRDDQKAW